MKRLFFIIHYFNYAGAYTQRSLLPLSQSFPSLGPSCRQIPAFLPLRQQTDDTRLKFHSNHG